MVNSERQIYIQETEIKPNKYASYVLMIMLVCILLCWIMNEVGLFRVDMTEMRIGSSVPLVVVSVPLLTMYIRPGLTAKPGMKYFIMTAVLIFTLTTTTLLTFHTTMMLLFPIFFAMLYKSKRLGCFAVISSIFCTVAAPIFGYMLHTWDVPLFEELILIATGGTTEIINPTYEINAVGIYKILLYLVGPRLMMVGSCSFLLFYIIGLGEAHVKNQILLNNVSKHDMLTGLYNQNCYKELLKNGGLSGNTGVIFFDVNGLKAMNDTFGHEYGDLLLKRCAQSILDVVSGDDEAAFRIGGDEFLLIMENADEEKVNKKLDAWEKKLERINRENDELYDGLRCSMAYGSVVGDITGLEQLVRRADELMYENKAIMKKKHIKTEG